MHLPAILLSLAILSRAAEANSPEQGEESPDQVLASLNQHESNTNTFSSDNVILPRGAHEFDSRDTTKEDLVDGEEADDAADDADEGAGLVERALMCGYKLCPAEQHGVLFGSQCECKPDLPVKEKREDDDADAQFNHQEEGAIAGTSSPSAVDDAKENDKRATSTAATATDGGHTVEARARGHGRCENACSEGFIGTAENGACKCKPDPCAKLGHCPHPGEQKHVGKNGGCYCKKVQHGGHRRREDEGEGEEGVKTGMAVEEDEGGQQGGTDEGEELAQRDIVTETQDEGKDADIAAEVDDNDEDSALEKRGSGPPCSKGDWCPYPFKAVHNKQSGCSCVPQDYPTVKRRQDGSGEEGKVDETVGTAAETESGHGDDQEKTKDMDLGDIDDGNEQEKRDILTETRDEETDPNVFTEAVDSDESPALEERGKEFPCDNGKGCMPDYYKKADKDGMCSCVPRGSRCPGGC